jgi:pimeloyl-ACP methyl ester carboxylesterase
MRHASILKGTLAALAAALSATAVADLPERVADVATRAGVTQRMLLIEPDRAKGVVVLYAGGHGNLRISPDGALGWGKGNFLVRSRQLFAAQGLTVAVVDAPSDRQGAGYAGFRDTPESAEDARAVIAWLRGRTKLPVWVVGTSRGTQSAAFIATQLKGRDGPDGIVLTSTVLRDKRERAVPEMALEKIAIPVLVVHHEDDQCPSCAFFDVPWLMRHFTAAPRKELIAMRGGRSQGDPCEAFAYHGYNGIEGDVVARIAAWIAGPRD